MPDIAEQRAMVKILDRVNEIEAEIIRSTEDVIKKIDTIKKSILAKAFRGELGTNDPADESAVELLRNVLD